MGHNIEKIQQIVLISSSFHYYLLSSNIKISQQMFIQKRKLNLHTNSTKKAYNNMSRLTNEVESLTPQVNMPKMSWMLIYPISL